MALQHPKKPARARRKLARTKPLGVTLQGSSQETDCKVR